MKVYAFRYNDCIFESSWATISIHMDRANAKKALWEHMKESFLGHREYKKYCSEIGLDRQQFGWRQDWHIAELEIQP